MGMSRNKVRSLALGLGFLAPNILGFLTFTFIPVIISLAMAFTNWDLTQHNQYKNIPIKFIGIDNFVRLFSNPDFFTYLGNTLYFMMGIPIGIAGSLGLAILLSKNFRSPTIKIGATVAASAIFGFSIFLLLVVNAGTTAIVIMLLCVFGACLLGGLAGGRSVYRALVFLPSFTSGVAVYVLWQKLYNPNIGPINVALRPVVLWLNESVTSTHWPMWCMWIFITLSIVSVYFTARRLLLLWRDGDIGHVSLAVSIAFLALPLYFAWRWIGTSAGMIYALACAGAILYLFLRVVSRLREFYCAKAEGFGSASMLALGVMALQFVLIGLAAWMNVLPDWVASPGGLQTPGWLSSFYWAKPAIMIMGTWACIGSGNMLLYIAGISNIPQELYEAADIDGVSPMQRFWHITWPQLAPTTFFIFVMSIIGGLQGGFETARVMTNGGPAGATTTLSYFIYSEGFQTGRLGYSSAVAWALFVLVFVITIINWRFGNKYVND